MEIIKSYSTSTDDGVEFIANRRTFTGDRGFRVVLEDNGTHTVESYNAAGGHPVAGGLGLGEYESLTLAARLSGKGE